jgi:hypothetical protein
LPHFMANRLSLCARGKPISFIARVSLFSSRSSSFIVIDRMHLPKDGLLMLCVTLIAKSISTLSILCKALNHTPARMALHLNFISCFLSMKLKVVFCIVVVGKVSLTSELNSLEPLSTLTFIMSQYLLQICISTKLTSNSEPEKAQQIIKTCFSHGLWLIRSRQRNCRVNGNIHDVT